MTDIDFQSASQSAISVSELNRQVRLLLDQGIARLWIEGEVSNLARPASGHLYFTLKDETAQLRCAWFRQRQRGPTIHLKNGAQMLVFGKVSVYEARGEYQLIVEQTELAGEGELRRRFEALKKKLAAEGLFDDAGKQQLPTLPCRIGVITSPSGAAVRDILTVLQRRFPSIPVVLYPSAVQGDTAARELVQALGRAARRAECDVLIVARGGGSLEDLWPFNEEAVARAIHDCPLPLVSAIGHEVDFTIADFVADVRAPTPSGAAVLVVPDRVDWQRHLGSVANRLAASGRRQLQDRAQSLDWLSRRLARCSPAATAARQSEWLRNLRQVLTAAMRHDLATRAGSVERIQSSLLQQSPAVRVQRSIQRLAHLQQRLAVLGRGNISGLSHRLRVSARALNAVSPLATLDRGYSIVSDGRTGKILTDAADVSDGAAIKARLARGTISAVVESAQVDDGSDAPEVVDD